MREKVGPNGHVIGAVSGGVDSSVAAVLLHRAIGDRFHAVMVDNGCLRKDEAMKVVSRLKDDLGINLSVVDAADRFLDALEGVIEPETKRKIIGSLFIEVFQERVSTLYKLYVRSERRVIFSIDFIIRIMYQRGINFQIGFLVN